MGWGLGSGLHRHSIKLLKNTSKWN